MLKVLGFGPRLLVGLIDFNWLLIHQLKKSKLQLKVDRPSSSIRVIHNRLTVTGWVFDEASNAAAPVRAKIGNETVSSIIEKNVASSGGANQSTNNARDCRFSIPLSLPPGIRRVSIQAQSSQKTWITIRRLVLIVLPNFRFRNFFSFRKPTYNQSVINENKALDTDIVAEIDQHIASMIVRPTFSIIIVTQNERKNVLQTLRSVEQQVYQHHEILLTSDVRPESRDYSLEYNELHLPELKNLEDIHGDYCLFIKAGDQLHSHALYEFASSVNTHAQADIIYADEDVVDGYGRFSNPFFKPDWSPDYLEVFNYIEFPCCYRTKLVVSGYQNYCQYDLALRSTEVSDHIVHIPKVLGHRWKTSTLTKHKKTKGDSDRRYLQHRLSRTGRSGDITEHTKHRGCYVITPRLTKNPLVSIVIPTAGNIRHVKGKPVDLVSNLVTQIFERSTYTNKEVIVVDSGTLSESQTQVLHHHHCKRTSDSADHVNIARKINLGAKKASGEYLLILNDDIEILTNNWLERMLGHFEKHGVGVVGCRLLYPKGTIQHAGIVFVQGHPEHVRRRRRGDEAGYFFSSCAPRNFMAVTGACMMTPLQMFLDIGGYNEDFPINYNDVAYCLSLGTKGLRTVCDNGVALTHLESASREKSIATSETAVFEQLWSEEVVTDPFYNNERFNQTKPMFHFEQNVKQI